MNSRRMKIFFPIVFLAVVVIITLICCGHYAKKELKQKINFVVAKIYITPASRCHIYDKFENKLDLNSYTFYENSGLKVGDSLVKISNSSTIFCYRKNSIGQYNVIKEFEPN